MKKQIFIKLFIYAFLVITYEFSGMDFPEARRRIVSRERIKLYKNYHEQFNSFNEYCASGDKKSIMKENNISNTNNFVKSDYYTPNNSESDSEEGPLGFTFSGESIGLNFFVLDNNSFYEQLNNSRYKGKLKIISMHDNSSREIFSYSYDTVNDGLQLKGSFRINHEYECTIVVCNDKYYLQKNNDTALMQINYSKELTNLQNFLKNMEQPKIIALGQDGSRILYTIKKLQNVDEVLCLNAIDSINSVKTNKYAPVIHTPSTIPKSPINVDEIEKCTKKGSKQPEQKMSILHTLFGAVSIVALCIEVAHRYNKIPFGVMDIVNKIIFKLTSVCPVINKVF
ncbi:MAG TPA: hypothetical protein VLB80_00125 [Candidatus Babeliales bacterium]|nr:hypothetical protein [Candidatus Babeliales bacterium]